MTDTHFLRTGNSFDAEHGERFPSTQTIGSMDDAPYELLLIEMAP